MTEAATQAVGPPIPRPPPDPGLPGLAVALDDEAMADLLTRRLPDCASGDLEVQSCRPRYIRYKSGTNCLVQYDLVLIDKTGRLVPTLAHARLYANHQAEVLWAGRDLHRLIDRARRLPGPPAIRAARLPELKGLVEIYPVDRKMRGLLDATAMDELRGVLPTALPEGAAAGVLERIDVVRYKPGRRAVLRYGLRDGERAAVYGRIHADERGAERLAAVRAFAAAGLDTPAPLGYIDDLGLMLIAEASGTRLADLRGTPEFVQWLPAVAQAIAALHATPVESLPPVAKRNKEGSALAAARTVAAVCPNIRERVLRLGATLAARLAESSVQSVPVHGDFYDDQVLVSSESIVLLDLDASGLGNPLLDVGNFLAQLTVRGNESARGVFLESYAGLRPDAREEWPLFEAAALLRLAVKPFRDLRPDWPDEVERIVELSARRLKDDLGSRHFSIAPLDARLPQLELLQDAARVARELERVLRTGPVEVTEAALVRHKPGRRCVLRYDMRLRSNGGGPTERVYGKAFASARGAQVYRDLHALASAAACGPEVAIPQPVGYILPWKLLLQRAVPGEPVAQALVAGDERLAVRIAQALHALHGSNVRLERQHELLNELAPLGGRVERLAAASPALEPRARRCLELTQSLGERSWEWRRRPVHRDFYPDQVLVGENGLSILDWDDAAMCEPAVDVANFTAHLRLLALQRLSRPDALDGVSAVFAERYRQLDPDLDPRLLRFLEGATLLRLAHIHRLRERGEWVAEHLLEGSEEFLTG